MTLKNNRAPLLSNIKLCASFHHHMWIQTGVTVRKRLSWVLTSVTLTFDLWPFARALLFSLVITPENVMMIRWWEHNEKGVCDRQTDRQTHTHRQTDGQTENAICRAAWSQLKTGVPLFAIWYPFHYHGLTSIPAWISNHMPSEVRNEITYPFQNFNCCTVEVYEWMNYIIPHFVTGVITYLCWSWSSAKGKKGALSMKQVWPCGWRVVSVEHKSNW